MACAGWSADPDRTALVARSGSLSYRELAAASRAATGDRTGVVPVLLPRSVDLVTTLLGIVRAGAGYAVLDPRWPRTRTRTALAMLKHAPDDVGCVFFTSGSSGRPKGIPVRRHALTRLLRPGAMPFRLDRSTVMTVAAPPSWDAFALELWGPLRAGGTCVLVEDDHLTPAHLREYRAAHGLNTVWLTSSLFSLVVEEDIGAFDGIAQVATGGERLSPEHVREFLLKHPRSALFNGYGPAENCVFATMHRITLADCDRATGIPIGRPVGGTGVRVLDGDRPCAPGELGELCLTGNRLSPGYLADPGLTRKAFVALAGERVYRTGDLGWRDADDLLHFHGRADRQLKVRGHRVEPAEVERRITAHPAVAQCVVVAGDHDDLVACYRRSGAVTPGELRQFTAAALPGYLVPDRWLPVDRIPLLANGKVDLAAVAAAPTRTAEPDPLRAIVRETTHLDPPDAAHSLVAAGANSLQLMRLCLRASRRFAVPVEPSEFFARPTIEHLRELVTRDRRVRRAPRTAHSSLNTTQSAFLVTEIVDPANRRAWHCALVWRIDGAVDAVALRSAVHQVHARHPALHARYRTLPPFSASTSPPAPAEFTVVDCVDERHADAVLDDLLNAPFALRAGPAWRAVLARVGDNRAVLGVTVHHVAFDGWSEHLLARDLSAAYAAGRAGAPGRWCAEPLRWPTPDIADDETVGRQRDQLARHLTGARALTFPRGDGTRSQYIVKALDDEQTRRCHQLARAHATTACVLGLAGFAVAAARLTGRTDFPVATPVVRRRADTEDTISCLLNLLCLRIRLPDGEDPVEAAAAALDQALRTQDVPFPEAIELLDPPVVPHLFVLQQNTPPRLDLPGCHTTLHRPNPRHAGFGLQVELRLPDGEPGEVVVSHRHSVIAPATAAEFTEAFVAFVTGQAS